MGGNNFQECGHTTGQKVETPLEGEESVKLNKRARRKQRNWSMTI